MSPVRSDHGANPCCNHTPSSCQARALSPNFLKVRCAATSFPDLSPRQRQCSCERPRRAKNAHMPVRQPSTRIRRCGERPPGTRVAACTKPTANRRTVMPEQKTIKRAQADKRAGKASSTQAGEFVKEQIDKVRAGKHGVRSARQAIAIGLSEARRAG